MGVINWNDGTTSTYGDGGGDGGWGSLANMLFSAGSSYLTQREQASTARRIADARLAAEQRLAQYQIDAAARENARLDLKTVSSVNNALPMSKNYAIALGLGLAAIYVFRR